MQVAKDKKDKYKYKDKYTSHNDRYTQIQHVKILICFKKSFLGLREFQNVWEKRMLFTKRAVAQRPPKAESWHEVHFEAHGEEINLPPRF